MGTITCERTACKHNKELTYLNIPNGHRICKRGSGYDYGGGDIKISKTGRCTCFERQQPVKTDK